MPRLPRPAGYIRLARNRSFTLLWLGQLISFLGDRLHQVAIGVAMLGLTGSPLALALTFVAAYGPTLVLGPVVGTLVDRYPLRRVMVVADLARAGMVLLLPAALAAGPFAVYGLTVLISVAALFFRPAKTAALPLTVEGRDLVRGNAAHSITETAADLVGYPAAGLLVAILGDQLMLAFALDAASYVASAACIVAMRLPDLPRPDARLNVAAIVAEMREGWAFLRAQAELLHNTLISIAAQLAIGAEIALSLVYAERNLDQGVLGYPENYSLLMAAVGAGSIVGGLLVTPLAELVGKGRLILGSFAIFGASMVAVGLVRDPWMAIGLYALIGLVNMGFLVPNMALFQERTPAGLMGRVVSIRVALVIGAMTVAMGGSGWAAEQIGVPAVFAAAGALTLLATAAGCASPALRRVR